MKTLDDILRRLAVELPGIDFTAEETAEKTIVYINDGLEDFTRAIVKLTPTSSLARIFDADYSGDPIPLDDLQFNHISKVLLDGQRLDPLSDATYSTNNGSYYAVEYAKGRKTLKIDPCLKQGRLQIIYFKNLPEISKENPVLEYPETFRYLVLNTKALLLADEGFPQSDRFMTLASRELGTILESFQFATDSSSNKLIGDDDIDIWGDMT